MILSKDANDELPDYIFELPDPTGRLVGRYAGVWIGVSGGDLPFPIRVRLGRTSEGRFCVTGLRLGAPDGQEEYEITAGALRRISLMNVLRAVREAARGVSGTEMDEPVAPLGLSKGEMMALSALEIPEDVTVRRGPRGLDPETLRTTAQVYLEVVRAGSRRPLADAGRRLHLDPSSVWRRLQNAWRRFPELRPMQREDES